MWLANACEGERAMTQGRLSKRKDSQVGRVKQLKVMHMKTAWQVETVSIYSVLLKIKLCKLTALMAHCVPLRVL